MSHNPGVALVVTGHTTACQPRLKECTGKTDRQTCLWAIAQTAGEPERKQRDGKRVFAPTKLTRRSADRTSEERR